MQDFTQAELLLGLRVVSNPNGLFFCGDTCQTIARGIGFRWETAGSICDWGLSSAGDQRSEAAAMMPMSPQPLEIAGC